MKIIKEMFAKNDFKETLLVEEKGEKLIIKNCKKNDKYAYQKTKRQFFDLQRLNVLCDYISPKAIEENETDTNYSFSSQYLEGYKNLHEIESDKEEIALKIALGKLSEIYSISKFINGIYFFEKTISDLNYKLEIYKNKYQKVRNLLYSKKLKINNNYYLGLTSVLSKINPNFFAPSKISPIHGNLNLSHILYDGKDSRLVSVYCQNFYDAPEKDLGSISADLICKRHEWPEKMNLIKQFDDEEIEIEEIEENLDIFNSLKTQWSLILKKESVFEIASLYMCFDLIENASSFSKTNKDYIYYSLLIAIKHLNELI